MKRRLMSQAGFTLIEVMIVILLLGIVAALVLPRGLATATNHAAVDAQAQQLAGLIRLAREKAMAAGTDYRVIINANNCSLESEATSASQDKQAQISIDSRVSIVPQPPLGSTIIFNSKGLPQYGGGTIKVQNKGGDPESKNLVINEQGLVEIN